MSYYLQQKKLVYLCLIHNVLLLLGLIQNDEISFFNPFQLSNKSVSVVASTFRPSQREFLLSTFVQRTIMRWATLTRNVLRKFVSGVPYLSRNPGQVWWRAKIRFVTYIPSRTFPIKMPFTCVMDSWAIPSLLLVLLAWKFFRPIVIWSSWYGFRKINVGVEPFTDSLRREEGRFENAENSARTAKVRLRRLSNPYKKSPKILKRRRVT